MKRIVIFCLIFGFLVSLSLSVISAPRKQSWNSWLQDVRKEAIAQGIDPNLFDHAFNGMTPSKKHISFDRRQPEKRLTYLQYLKTRGDAFRIKLGRKELSKHRTLLNAVEHSFGVSPCFIVAIWGLESSYGRFMGGFPVLRSLATLAYDTRRSKFFRKELFLALHILNEGHVSLKDFKGEWAGASGQPQFLPSSWHNYAVDYNKDGQKDIWRTHGDIFASIANYLAQNGWQPGQPVTIQVSLPNNFNKSLLGSNTIKTIHDWQNLGVRLKGHYAINPNEETSIIHPDGGPDLMIFNNFRVLMKWNRSIYYAGTVEYMAQNICRA